MKRLGQIQLALVGVALGVGFLVTRLESTPEAGTPLVWSAVGAYVLAALILWTSARRSARGFLEAQAVALISVAVTLVGGAYVLRAHTQAPAAGAPAQDGCFTLKRWDWEETKDGRAHVTADLLPVQEGTLALDASALATDTEVWGPEVVSQKLPRVDVQPGVPARLERWLRRTGNGTPESFILRVSCRPAQLTGMSGVIAYASKKALASLEGTRDLVRPLPPPGLQRP